MTWTNYETVQYQDSSGSFTCPNTECVFFLQYDKTKKVHFSKTGACRICSVQDDWYSGDGRKYTAFIINNKAHVSCYGDHSCDAKFTSTGPTDLAQKAVSADSNTRPDEI